MFHAARVAMSLSGAGGVVADGLFERVFSHEMK